MPPPRVAMAFAKEMCVNSSVVMNATTRRARCSSSFFVDAAGGTSDAADCRTYAANALNDDVGPAMYSGGYRMKATYSTGDA